MQLNLFKLLLRLKVKETLKSACGNAELYCISFSLNNIPHQYKYLILNFIKACDIFFL